MELLCFYTELALRVGADQRGLCVSITSRSAGSTVAQLRRLGQARLMAIAKKAAMATKLTDNRKSEIPLLYAESRRGSKTYFCNGSIKFCDEVAVYSPDPGITTCENTTRRPFSGCVGLPSFRRKTALTSRDTGSIGTFDVITYQ